MYVDDVVVAEPVVAPHRFEELVAGERAARTRRQQVQQVELDFREVDELALRGHLADDRVDADRAELPGRRLGDGYAPRAAAHRLDTGGQLPRRERLRDV